MPTSCILYQVYWRKSMVFSSALRIRKLWYNAENMNRMRLIGTILTVAFFALTLCGAGLLATHKNIGAHVPGCPFANTMDASCPLSAINQLGNFATVLGSLPISSVSLLLLVACLALASVAIAITPSASHRPPRVDRIDDSAVWRTLQLAFARGILNPKLF